MAMHGHTKIELQDVYTGQKKIVEDDNMVTNALAEMLRPANGWCNLFHIYNFVCNPSKDTDVNYMLKEIMGGIVCLERTQEEKPENFLWTGENPVVAKGSNFAYSGVDNTQGSYNFSESGMQEDGSFKKVWDFSTNQGNGTISSVSLTTAKFGRYGDGCSVSNDTSAANEVQARYTTKTIGSEYPGFNDTTFNNMSGLVCYMDYLNNAIFAIGNRYSVEYSSSFKDIYFYNASKIILKKFMVPFSKISPFLNPYNMNRYEEIEISIPDSILAQCDGVYNGASWYCDDGYIFFLFHKAGSIKPGENVNILKVKVEDFSTEVISIINTTPGNWQISNTFFKYYSGDESGYLGNASAITNNYLIVITSVEGEKRLYRIDLNNSANITEFRTVNGEKLVLQSGGSYIGVFNRIGNILYIENSSVSGYACNINTCIAKYRKMAGSTIGIFLNNYGENTHHYDTFGRKSPVMYKPRWEWKSGGAYGNGVFQLEPNFKTNILFTINNLPTPVVKTASQTMKITYTISEE